MSNTKVRILEHRVKFFDGRPDELTDCSSEEMYKSWLQGKTASSVVVQNTSQQEYIKFKVEGGPVKGLTRTNKTAKFGIPMRTDHDLIGDFTPGIHTHVFPKQNIENIPAARAKWVLTTTYHDKSGKEFCRRESTFQIIAPR